MDKLHRLDSDDVDSPKLSRAKTKALLGDAYQDPLPLLRHEASLAYKSGIGAGKMRGKYYGENLYLYKKKGKFVPTKSFYIGDMSSVDDSNNLNGSFSVNLNNGKTLDFDCSTAPEAAKWVTVLRDAIAQYNNKTNPYRTIEIFFMDGTRVPMVITSKTTAEDLWWAACEKMNLLPEARQYFFIWAVGHDLDILLCNDDILETVITKWHKTERLYSKTLQGPLKFIFKTSHLLPLSQERNLKNAKAVHLFYIQAQYHVSQNNYLIDLTTAIELAGIQAQIKLGNFTGQRGYLIKELGSYIPSYLAKKHDATTFENLIAVEHKKHLDKNLYISELLYLQRVRSLPYYGSVFYETVNKEKGHLSGYYNTLEEGVIIIAINSEGIHVIKRNKYLHSFEWKQIQHWEIEQGKYFYFQGYNKKQKLSATYLLETKAAYLIKDQISDIIYELKNQKKIVRNIRRQQTMELLDKDAIRPTKVRVRVEAEVQEAPPPQTAPPPLEVAPESEDDDAPPSYVDNPFHDESPGSESSESSEGDESESNSDEPSSDESSDE